MKRSLCRNIVLVTLLKQFEAEWHPDRLLFVFLLWICVKETGKPDIKLHIYRIKNSSLSLLIIITIRYISASLVKTEVLQVSKNHIAVTTFIRL